MDEGVYFSFPPCSSTVIVLIPVFPAGFLTVSVLIPFVVLATGWVVSCFGNLVLLIYFTWTAPNTLSNVTHGGVCKMTFISPFCQTCIHYCVIAYFLNRTLHSFSIFVLLLNTAGCVHSHCLSVLSVILLSTLSTQCSISLCLVSWLTVPVSSVSLRTWFLPSSHTFCCTPLGNV